MTADPKIHVDMNSTALNLLLLPSAKQSMS